MAYSNIPDTEIEPGKPGSSGLFTKMRDNPEAIAAGAAGAPKIANAAFNDDTINGLKMVDNSISFAGKALAHNEVEVDWVINYQDTLIIPKGIWTLVRTDDDDSGLSVRVFSGGGWVGTDEGALTSRIVTSDGINVGLYSNVGDSDVRARKIF